MIRCVGILAAVAGLAACGPTATAPEEEPDETPVMWKAVSMAGGGFFDFTCGLSVDGAAYCWGDGGVGQLGNGSTEGSRRPVPVSGSQAFVSIESGTRHSCTLTDDGTAWCWGEWRILETRTEPVPVPGGFKFLRLALGNFYSCGMIDGDEWRCWGSNSWAIASPEHEVPQPIPGELRFEVLAAGLNSVCGATGGGAAYCWGYNDYGQLGNGSHEPSLVPVAVVGGHQFAAISPASSGGFCGLTEGGETYCWGSLGGSTPQLVPGGVAFTEVTAGSHHACGLSREREAYCWGWADQGQLGNGLRFTSSDVPVAVAGGHEFTTLYAGGNHTCGVTPAGEAYCWGSNGYGELGDASAAAPLFFDNFRPTPVQVAHPLKDSLLR